MSWRNEQLDRLIAWGGIHRMADGPGGGGIGGNGENDSDGEGEAGAVGSASDGPDGAAGTGGGGYNEGGSSRGKSSSSQASSSSSSAASADANTRSASDRARDAMGRRGQDKEGATVAGPTSDAEAAMNAFSMNREMDAISYGMTKDPSKSHTDDATHAAKAMGREGVTNAVAKGAEYANRNYDRAATIATMLNPTVGLMAKAGVGMKTAMDTTDALGRLGVDRSAQETAAQGLRGTVTGLIGGKLGGTLGQVGGSLGYGVAGVPGAVVGHVAGNIAGQKGVEAAYDSGTTAQGVAGPTGPSEGSEMNRGQGLLASAAPQQQDPTAGFDPYDIDINQYASHLGYSRFG